MADCSFHFFPVPTNACLNISGKVLLLFLFDFGCNVVKSPSRCRRRFFFFVVNHRPVAAGVFLFVCTFFDKMRLFDVHAFFKQTRFCTPAPSPQTLFDLLDKMRLFIESAFV